jgi:ABC-type uncharacterized transport system substrate-binding protein
MHRPRLLLTQSGNRTSVLTSKNTICVGAHETAGLSRYSRLRGGLAGRTEGAIDRPDTHCWDAHHSRSGRSGGESTVAVLEQALRQLGWFPGRDLKIELREVGRDVERLRRYSGELATLAPDVIICIGSVTLAPLLQATRAIPIVFMNVPDPVGAGFVQSMAHPGGNATGFLNFGYSISGKWAELLRQIAPNVTRALVLRDSSSAAGIGQFAAVRSIAQGLGIELTPTDVNNADEIERIVGAFARSGNGGVIVTAGGTAAHRKLIISLVARYKLPTVYPYRYYAVDGGLITYGPNSNEQVRRAAGYVDRILKGEKPADLPVQAPTKYELIVNLKTAKTLG